MIGIKKCRFLGSNTPSGFYSYYDDFFCSGGYRYLYCLKGGPGTGKSTLMKNIGAYFLERGEDVDFFYCSSDKCSVDAVFLKKRGVGIMDTTPPHVIEPGYPGITGNIIDFGNCLNKNGLLREKEKIISLGESNQFYYRCAFNYLKSAGSILDNLYCIQKRTTDKSLYSSVVRRIIDSEFCKQPVITGAGRIVKSFAWAITPQGIISVFPRLLQGIHKLYRIRTDYGMAPERILKPIAAHVQSLGIRNIELLYSSFNPEDGLEGIILPESGLALIVEPPFCQWDEDSIDLDTETVFIDLKDEINHSLFENGIDTGISDDCRRRFTEMLQQGIQCLSYAKQVHDDLEVCYRSYADFGKTDRIREQLISDIKRQV